jgi:hypothetical protein
MDLQHLVQVEGVHRGDDVAYGKRAEARHRQGGTGNSQVKKQQIECVVQTVLLDRVEEIVGPVVQNHIQRDHDQVERDDRGEQAPRAPAFFRPEIGFGSTQASRAPVKKLVMERRIRRARPAIFSGE